MEELGLRLWRSDPGCQAISYRRGNFAINADFQCTLSDEHVDAPDSKAAEDSDRIENLLAATGVDVAQIWMTQYDVEGRLLEAEFDLDVPAGARRRVAYLYVTGEPPPSGSTRESEFVRLNDRWVMWLDDIN